MENNTEGILKLLEENENRERIDIQVYEKFLKSDKDFYFKVQKMMKERLQFDQNTALLCFDYEDFESFIYLMNLKEF